MEKAGAGWGGQVGGWRHGAASVGDGFKTYFWPQVKVPVSAEDAPSVLLLPIFFFLPQSCLKASLSQEQDALC